MRDQQNFDGMERFDELDYSRLLPNFTLVESRPPLSVIAGPGLVVMVADNDAGGITTYAATGAKYGYYLIWFLVLLGPVAYYVQEMTVRLGAVTKRGHAEAIFDGFGAFWGWFSLLDLMLDRLADPGHRIHRHDLGAGHFRRPRLGRP